MTLELSTELHGLHKFANYSVQVWAFTRVGDGDKSSPIFCHTDEDGMWLNYTGRNSLLYVEKHGKKKCLLPAIADISR